MCWAQEVQLNKQTDQHFCPCGTAGYHTQPTHTNYNFRASPDQKNPKVDVRSCDVFGLHTCLLKHHFLDYLITLSFVTSVLIQCHYQCWKFFQASMLEPFSSPFTISLSKVCQIFNDVFQGKGKQVSAAGRGRDESLHPIVSTLFPLVIEMWDYKPDQWARTWLQASTIIKSDKTKGICVSKNSFGCNYSDLTGGSFRQSWGRGAKFADILSGIIYCIGTRKK